MSYNDSLKQSLVSLGYTGSIDDALNKFLQDRTDIASTTTPDMMYAWLGGLGYTGSLSDRLQQHAVANGYSSHAAQVIAGASLTRYAYNMDGIDDRWTLANRAIDPDGDIDIEFYTPSNISTGAFRSIVSQCVSATSTLREFDLFISGTSGSIGLTIGGTASTVALAGTFTASAKYRFTLIGNQSTIYDASGNVIRTATITRGAAREPSAVTTIGARFNGTSYLEFFIGIQRDIKINGTLWPMADRNQAVQPSIPAGNNMTGANLNPDRWQEVPL